MFVGWDWAAETHDVTVVDDAGGVVAHWALRHDEQGIARTIERLADLAPARELPVAIETASGLIVERLVAAGHPLVPIHPNALHVSRPRWGAAGAKSDPGDSYRLADYLRTDGHRLRRLRPLDAATLQLQALVRRRDDHVELRVAATNQLGALLADQWPGAAALFARLDSAIALEFLERYPTPGHAAHVGELRLAAFLRRHGYSGRRSASELLARLRAAASPGSTLDADVLTDCVRAQVAVIRALRRTITGLERAIRAVLPDHPMASILGPLPRIGQLNLAQVLAEVGPIVERAASAEQAAAEIGAAPVTKASGKGRSVVFRWAANARARDALGIFADNSRHASSWAANLYAGARQRGKRHPGAIRVLMRAWTRVIWTCWHTGVAYDPTRHGAELRLAAA
jgi:transposase